MTAVQFLFPLPVVTSTTEIYTRSNSSTSILPIFMGMTLPKIGSYNMEIYNNSGVSIAIQPVTNNQQTANNTATPDFNVGSSTTVSSGSIAIVYVSAFDSNPLEMLSATVRFKAIPTSADIYGWVNLYYNY